MKRAAMVAGRICCCVDLCLGRERRSPRRLRRSPTPPRGFGIFRAAADRSASRKIREQIEARDAKPAEQAARRAARSRQDAARSQGTAAHHRLDRQAARDAVRRRPAGRAAPDFVRHRQPSDADRRVQRISEEPPSRLQSLRRDDALHAAHHLVGRRAARRARCPAIRPRTAASGCRPNSRSCSGRRPRSARASSSPATRPRRSRSSTSGCSCRRPGPKSRSRAAGRAEAPRRVEPAPDVAPKPEPRLDIISERKSAPVRDGETIATRAIAMVKTADATGTLRGPLQPDVVVKPLAPDTGAQHAGRRAADQAAAARRHGRDCHAARGPRRPPPRRCRAETVVVERAAPVEAMAKADVIRIDAKSDRSGPGWSSRTAIEAPVVTVAAAAAPVPAARPSPRPSRRAARAAVSVFVSLQGEQALRPPGHGAAVRRAGDHRAARPSRSAPMSTPRWARRPTAAACAGPWCRSRAATSAPPSPRPATAARSRATTSRGQGRRARSRRRCRARSAALDRIVMPPDAVERIADADRRPARR